MQFKTTITWTHIFYNKHIINFWIKKSFDVIFIFFGAFSNILFMYTK